MKHPRPNLKYVDADDLDDKAVKFKGMEVDSVNGDKLGKVEGFIIDTSTGRPFHIVVGAGHLFTHKHFLLPVGHATLAPSNDKLIADVPKERVARFPGFDKDLFPKMSEEDINRLTEQLATACCPDEVIAVEVSAWDTAHYTYPTWWQADFYRPDRADEAGMNIGGASGWTGAGMPPAGGAATTDGGYQREQMRASETAGDTSPHLAGRAQPGDVLGVETGGERTYVGETSEDENKRRRDAEEAARKR
jgi:sporulation protein YlmC with PRC-barrel domain